MADRQPQNRPKTTRRRGVIRKTPNTCPCGRLYMIWPHQKGKSTYCSKLCMDTYRKPLGKKDHAWIKRKCMNKNCKKIFMVERWRIKNPQRGKYCSIDCRNSKVGDEAPNWQGGISARYQNMHYTTEYHVLRTKLLKQFKECGKCGNQNNLVMDHIIPIAIQPELAYAENNLQIICRKCHLIKTSNDLREIARFKKERIYA